MDGWLRLCFLVIIHFVLKNIPNKRNAWNWTIYIVQRGAYNVTPSRHVAKAQIILNVNDPALLKCNFMQCVGLLVFRQLVNFQRAVKGQDEVCVKVHYRDSRQSKRYEMRKVEQRERKRGGRSIGKVERAFGYRILSSSSLKWSLRSLPSDVATVKSLWILSRGSLHIFLCNRVAQNCLATCLLLWGMFQVKHFRGRNRMTNRCSSVGGFCTWNAGIQLLHTVPYCCNAIVHSRMFLRVR